MLVSFKNKFIFLSNPKCGSSTLRVVLDPYKDLNARGAMGDNEDFKKQGTLVLHIPAYELKQSFDQSEHVGKWEDYYKFTTVRNPFKRMVSWYFFLQPDKNFDTILDRNDEGTWDRHSAYAHHFNDFMDNFYNDPKRGLLPNYNWFCTDWETGEDLLDDTFKLEEIDSVFGPRFKEKTGIETPSPMPNILPDLRTEEERSSHIKFKGNPYDLYNENSIKMIEEAYELDLEKFNYKFGD
tara:strand:+ start:398 stop:1111 length:714 start_codon:yes stop_codon:yes gene_type:complete